MIRKMNLKSRILVITALSLSSLLTQCKKDEVIPEEQSSLSSTDSLAQDSLTSIGSTPSDSSSQLGPIPDDIKLAATGIISSSYYLVKSLPSGYVKDGSRDYTSYIQAAVSKYSNIVFPSFPILVNAKGITIPSNRTITFPSGSEIRLKPTSLGNYSILRIKNVSNVTLYGPKIRGDRYNHIGTSGEWGMGIGIYGASNVKIYSARVTRCWGDGIYMGQYESRINNKNILIKDSQIWSNRRDGITVIGVDGLLLENIYSGYNDGTSPYCGINFEPNNSYSELKNIKIRNSKTEKNRNGIQIGTQHLVKNSNKYIDITIENHQDVRSPRYPFKIAGNVSSGYSGKIYGSVNIINPKLNATFYETNLPVWLSSNQSNFKINVSSPDIYNSSGSLLSWSSTYSLFMKADRGGNFTLTR